MRIVVLLRDGQARWLFSGARRTAGPDSAGTLGARRKVAVAFFNY